MIRKLIESDREIALEFLSDEPAINLFIIGDIENFGFDEDFQEIWGSFNSSNILQGVLLRFNESFIPYYKDDNFDITDFKNIINSKNMKRMISGKESIVERFKGILKNPIEKSMYFCEIENPSKLKKSNAGKIEAPYLLLLVH